MERTVSFGLACYSLAIVCYSQHDQPAHDLAARRALVSHQGHPIGGQHARGAAPVLIATQYRQGPATAPTMAETLQAQAARAAAAA
ncbi:MAG TPA: hypothetical protein VFA46_05790 [Actinomycetes bacterium]|nr:hypothetical protein [Actinomycetes bacterium]